MDGSKTIDFKEFLLLSSELDKNSLRKMKLRFKEIYNTMDKDKSQKLTVKEFTDSLGLTDSTTPFAMEIQDMFKNADNDGDNLIDLDEFNILLSNI